MWKDSIRNIVVIFQTNILRIVGFYVRHSANTFFTNFLFFKFSEPEKVKKTFFLGLILRFSNLNVLHKGLLLQDWVFRLG